MNRLDPLAIASLVLAVLLLVLAIAAANDPPTSTADLEARRFQALLMGVLSGACWIGFCVRFRRA